MSDQDLPYVAYPRSTPSTDPDAVHRVRALAEFCLKSGNVTLGAMLLEVWFQSSVSWVVIHHSNWFQVMCTFVVGSWLFSTVERNVAFLARGINKPLPSGLISVGAAVIAAAAAFLPPRWMLLEICPAFFILIAGAYGHRLASREARRYGLVIRGVAFGNAQRNIKLAVEDWQAQTARAHPPQPVDLYSGSPP